MRAAAQTFTPCATSRPMRTEVDGHDAADRDVDLAGDHQQRLRDRHHAEHADHAGGGEQVRLGQEKRRADPDEDEDDDQDQDSGPRPATARRSSAGGARARRSALVAPALQLLPPPGPASPSRSGRRRCHRSPGTPCSSWLLMCHLPSGPRGAARDLCCPRHRAGCAPAARTQPGGCPYFLQSKERGLGGDLVACDVGHLRDLDAVHLVHLGARALPGPSRTGPGTRRRRSAGCCTPGRGRRSRRRRS